MELCSPLLESTSGSEAGLSRSAGIRKCLRLIQHCTGQRSGAEMSASASQSGRFDKSSRMWCFGSWNGETREKSQGCGPQAWRFLTFCALEEKESCEGRSRISKHISSTKGDDAHAGTEAFLSLNNALLLHASKGRYKNLRNLKTWSRCCELDYINKVQCVMVFFPLLWNRAEAGGAGPDWGREDDSSLQHPGPKGLPAGHKWWGWWCCPGVQQTQRGGRGETGKTAATRENRLRSSAFKSSPRYLYIYRKKMLA